MQQFEKDYAQMVKKILNKGSTRETRNGTTRSLFGMSLTVPVGEQMFPLIQGRKIYTAGIFGELAAMLRKHKNIADFEKWGCNYWKLWGDEKGDLTIDYGNLWHDFNGFDQIADLKHKLENNPTDRRMIISGWRPGAELSLPCCHYSYQFYVDGVDLHMIWTQRSADMMIGVPSDIVFAAAWLIAIANEFALSPASIKMDFGDCHVYEEHLEQAKQYVQYVETIKLPPTYYMYDLNVGKDFCEFEPEDILIGEYDHCGPMKLELKK